MNAAMKAYKVPGYGRFNKVYLDFFSLFCFPKEIRKEVNVLIAKAS